MDGRPAPRDPGAMTKHSTIHTPGGGERLELYGNVLDVKLSAAESGGELAVVEYDAIAGFPGPPLHVHDFDELFYVLAGRLTIRAGDDAHELEAGGCGYVVGDLPHTFANATDERVRFLCVCAPGGFEDYFRALVSGDQAAVAAASERHGLRTVGAASHT
jgi:mannose-6-phosphate isomerase-like protein (cupin superfamily)